MTQYTSFQVGGANGNFNAFTNRTRGVESYQWDISKFVATNGLVSADNEILFRVPANTQLTILAVRNDSALALGTTPVFSLGDSSSTTLFVNASSTVTTGSYQTVSTASKTYSAADYVRVTLSNASGTIASGLFSVIFEMIDLSANPVAQASVSV